MASDTEKTPRRAYSAATLYKNVKHFIETSGGFGDEVTEEDTVNDLLSALSRRIVHEETGYMGT